MLAQYLLCELFECRDGMIFWKKSHSRWQAQIGVNLRCIYLGIFDNLEDAIAARKAAEEKYFGEFCRSYTGSANTDKRSDSRSICL